MRSRKGDAWNSAGLFFLGAWFGVFGVRLAIVNRGLLWVSVPLLLISAACFGMREARRRP